MKPRAIFACIIFITLLFILIVPLNIFAKSYSIKWAPKKIERMIGLGDSTDVTVTFESNTDLSNVDLWVVPELEPFVIIEVLNHQISCDIYSYPSLALAFFFSRCYSYA